MEEVQRCDVLIVGGGLVGSICACYMGQRGYNVNLYEKREDIRIQKLARGRSINLAMSKRAEKALKEVGLDDDILKTGVPMKGRLLHLKNGTIKNVPYDNISKQFIYSVSRNYLNSTLLNATKKFKSVSLNFNHKLISADLNKGVATIKNLITDECIKVEADLIVGADGAFSAVRKEMQKMPLFTFSQTYIEHGYMELSIEPDNGSKMVQNHLHIWPRGSFMMIALPNIDGTWTVTLFMPFDKFQTLDTKEKVLKFFETTFPDSIPLIGKDRLITDFFRGKPSTLLSIKCNPYNAGKGVLIGDAAHAMVPFYGQGMNAGFEDCSILNHLLTECNGDISQAIKEFSRNRKEDAHAICELAMYNYLEMRDLVSKPSYHLRKHVDEILYWLFPKLWIPLYYSVTFTYMNYKRCMDNREWQNNVFKKIFVFFIIVIPIILTVLL